MTTARKLKEFKLPKEGRDKGFITASGMRLRAKARITDRRVIDGPANAAPTSMTITLSLAELDAKNAVKKEGDAFLIHEPHEILVSEQQLADPKFSLPDLVRGAIEDLAQRAETVAGNRSKALRYLGAEWGLSAQEQ